MATSTTTLNGAAPRPATANGARRRLTLWLLGAGLIVVLLAAGAWWLFGRPAEVRYTTAPLSTGQIVHSVTASGTVNPQLTVLVGAYVSGTILDVSCDFNTRVHRGQVCAHIDPRPYQSVVDQSAAALGVAQAQLDKDRAALEYAEVADRRYQQLMAQNSIARDLADQAHSAAAQATAQIALDQATVTQRRAALAAARVNLDYTAIVSPVDGTVVARNVTQGQTVASSFQTPTLFLIATDLTRMQVDANVSESDIGGDLRLGDAATFTVDAYPNRVFKAVVSQIRQSPQTVQNVVTYDVVLTADNTDLALRPGMTATCKIIVAERDGVLRAPSQALRYRPGGGGRGPGNGAGRRPTAGQARVWVLRDGKPAPVAVTQGLSDDAYTEVSGQGLSAGVAVITGDSAAAARATTTPTPAMRF